jgi:hypothetical protein
MSFHYVRVHLMQPTNHSRDVALSFQMFDAVGCISSNSIGSVTLVNAKCTHFLAAALQSCLLPLALNGGVVQVGLLVASNCSALFVSGLELSMEINIFIA